MRAALLVVLACFGFAAWGLQVHNWWWADWSRARSQSRAGGAYRAVGRLEWALGTCIGLAAGEAFVLGLKGPHAYEVVDPLIAYGLVGSVLGLRGRRGRYRAGIRAT